MACGISCGRVLPSFPAPTLPQPFRWSQYSVPNLLAQALAVWCAQTAAWRAGPEVLTDMPARILAILPGCSQRSLRHLVAHLRMWDTAATGKASLADVIHILRIGRLQLGSEPAPPSQAQRGVPREDRDDAAWESLKQQVCPLQGNGV